MDDIAVVGLDLAKNVLQVHGVCADGAGSFPPSASPIAGPGILRTIVALPRWYGSLRIGPPLGDASSLSLDTRSG